MKASKIDQLKQSAVFSVLLLISISEVIQGDSCAERLVVDTNNGKIKGVCKTTLIQNVEYMAFRGVPYAKPPVGALRLEPPQPVEPWAPKVLNATKFGDICSQPINPFGYESQSEDCLFLNIYVPKAKSNCSETFAVMFYIPGGAFIYGSGNDAWYGPDFLIEQNVILVTMNYRLGAFGFLSLGTQLYPGNLGLKDQQMALKWVHSNIHHFSGDNNRITIFGESAGGVSTHFHILSNVSRKYFRNAIPMSGAVQNLWSMWEETNMTVAYKIAEESGKSIRSYDELVNFYKTASASTIIAHQPIQGSMLRTLQPELAPNLERKDATYPFMIDSPSEIYEKNTIDVNVMFSSCTSEFKTFYSPLYGDCYNLEGLNRNFKVTFPFRDIEVDYDSPEIQAIQDTIRHFYFKNADINQKTLPQYIDLFSDINFNYGIQTKALEDHVRKTSSQTYYYRFSIDSKLNVMKRFYSGARHLQGATHGDDLCYMFRCRAYQGIYDEILRNPDDEGSKISLQAIDNITKLLANFAKYNEPTHMNEPVEQFLPIQGDQVHFIDLTNDGLKQSINPNEERNKFWAEIEQKLLKIRPSDNVLQVQVRNPFEVFWENIHNRLQSQIKKLSDAFRFNLHMLS